ncbi:ABC transporter ATP-binding protein [Paenibacillus humicola]|uniref:ABC transporter ATP-binding protein n=1 Tax=Paenibacillus humicola TaxID=3110540 RepID=UPI00237BE758|nr:ABC transporter ATP-binding protein [Paenibacillus humicola]
MSVILEINRMTKLYKKGRGVRDVSFEIAEGEVFGFVGPNGAGKTTLLKIATGLLRPDQGIVRIGGYDLAEHFERAMALTGCIIESAEAYEYMSAYDNLKLAARYYPDLPKTRIDQALEEAGLSRYKKERVSGFSLGMKQRLALASALLSHPRLVILDEPTNGLDVEGMADVRNTIARLARDRGIAFLVSSHQIHDLGMIAGRIGILNNGSLVKLARPEEWLSEGKTPEQFVLPYVQTAKGADVYA